MTSFKQSISELNYFLLFLTSEYSEMFFLAEYKIFLSFFFNYKNELIIMKNIFFLLCSDDTQKHEKY